MDVHSFQLSTLEPLEPSSPFSALINPDLLRPSPQDGGVSTSPLYAKHIVGNSTISEKDPDLLFIVDTPDEAVKVITDYHTKAKLKPNF